jgi:Protein of unknown function (DUF3108)
MKNIKLLKIFISLTIFTAGILFAQQITETTQIDSSGQLDKPDSVQVSDTLVYPQHENNAFQVGEKLTFRIRYGFITAGTATMSVLREMEFGDSPVYQIRTTAESASSFSWIYEVKDVVYSYMDKFGLFSWRFEKKLREGSYKFDLNARYIPKDSLIKVENIRYTDDMKIKKKEEFQLKSQPFIRDVLAAFYFIRSQNLDVGKSIFMSNHDNKKTYDLEVKVYKREVLEVEAGKFRCLYIEPLLQGEGIFKQKGRLKVWVTDDQYKIPVQMTSEVIVGHITTELIKIEGIPYKIPAKLD